MKIFELQCITYLLVNGWLQGVDGWEWKKVVPAKDGGVAYSISAESTGQALDLQFEEEEVGG